MRIIITLALALIFAIVTNAQTDKEFRKQLSENDLVFSMPDDFTETIVKENRDLYYNYAIKYDKDTFEVRYTIFSLKPVIKEFVDSKDDPNKSILDPNKYHSSMFLANILNVSQLGMDNVPQRSSFPLDAVNKEFGADFGATSFFQANSQFAEGYNFCLMIVLHKKDVADVYVSFLGNNQKKFEEYMLKAFHSLQFKK